MASKSKVNVRFVVTLSVVLSAVVIGLLGTAFFVLTHSGAELESLGDQAMKDKDFKSAITYYGKAFSDDQANIPRLTKYCDSMLAYTPENQALYDDYYWKRFIPAKLMRANLLKTDVAAQQEVLDILTRNMYESGYGRHGWDQIIDFANGAIASFEAGAPVPGWEKLKRYRALAWLEIAGNETSIDEKQAEALENDLTAVAALDPDDEQVALGLVSWYTLNATKAADAGRSTEEADWRAKAQTTLDAYRAAHPDSVLAALTAVAAKVEAAARAADPRKFSAEQRLKLLRDSAAAIQPEVAAVAELIRRVGPDKVESGTLYRLNRLERFAFDNKDDQSRALIARAIEINPGKADLRYMAGRLAEDTGQFEQAITHYQALLDLPIPTLSLDGVMLYHERLSAMAQQAEAAMGIWERLDETKQKDEKAAALQRVIAYKDKLAREVPETNLELLLINAKIAFAAGELADAQRLLQSHLQQTNQNNPDSVRLAGVVAMRLNQPGIARDLFVRLIELQPGIPSPHILKADVEGMLENHQAALTDYMDALGIDPENAYAKERIQQLRSIVSRVAEDPLQQAMLEADALWTGAPVTSDRTETLGRLEQAIGPLAPDLRNLVLRGAGAPNHEAAVALLEQTIARFPDDARLIAMLTTYYYNVTRLDDAKTLCARGLQIEPANDRLKSLEVVLNSKDQYEAGLTLIDLSPSSPVEKLMAKVRLAKRFDKPDDARAFLAQAYELAPADPSVIEYRFTDALTSNRADEAAQIAAQATALNLDKLNGASYAARILVSQKKKAEAIEVLKNGLNGPAASPTPEVWRFLGQVQSELGEDTGNDHLRQEALTSLNEALRMRPNDLGTILDTLKTLVHLNRYEPALDLARKSELLGRGNPEFRDLWLRLEASAGDKGRVIAIRRAIRRDQPDNDVNNLALLQTDIDIGGSAGTPEFWAEARALLDLLRAKQDSLLLAQLDARWHADQGDRDGGRKVYLDFIAAQKAANPKMAPEPLVALAQYLMGIGDTQGGMDALQEARQYQDPARLEVDLTLGMMLCDLGKPEEALPVFENFLAAGVPDTFPTPFAVRARYTETLLRLNRPADAEKSLDAAGPEAGQTMALMLLRAGARQVQKDDAGALKLINEAITKYPAEPLGYVKRAELASTSADAVSDAIADLDTALRLKPDLWNALQLRALLKIRQNRQDEAMDDLKAVVKGNPTVVGPRTALLQALVEADKFTEAVEVANGAANQRPRDIIMLMNLGDLFGTYAAQLPEALAVSQRFYDRAWKLNQSPGIAVVYTRSLLRSRNADLNLVGQILSTPGLDVEHNPQLLMSRAVMLNRQGYFDRSRAEAAQALRLVITNPGDTSTMLDQLAPVFGDPFNNKGDMAALIAFVQALDMTGLPDLWPDFFRARYKILDPQSQEEAMSRLRLVVAGAQDPTLQKLSRQFLSAALIGSGDKAAQQGNDAAARPLYEEALDIIKGALKLDPENAEALNNGAYLLAQNLKRPEEAIPMAEQAVKLMPNAGPYWDTLGLAYLEVGRFADADKALNRAVGAGGTIDDRMQIGIKLIRVKIGLGDRTAAQKILDDANKATSSREPLKARYQNQLDALQKDIDAMK